MEYLRGKVTFGMSLWKDIRKRWEDHSLKLAIQIKNGGWMGGGELVDRGFHFALHTRF